MASLSKHKNGTRRILFADGQGETAHHLLGQVAETRI